MGRCSLVGHGSRRIASSEHDDALVSNCRPWPYISLWMLLAVIILLSWPANVVAMRPDRIAQLRQETVDMFYHGYDNYMEIAFPEDEVRYTRHAFLGDGLTRVTITATAYILRTADSRCSESKQHRPQRRPRQLLPDTH